MSLSTLWTWFFDNIGVWIVIAYCAWGFIKGANDGAWGKAITQLAIGAFAYYYSTNPESVMKTLSSIIAKVFNGG
ncbi:TcpD family membrane protein [Streptococcus sp. zg-JUN1979]|uniref:TcpD family membrane protein n=1 Tax=Streptococcus sp. zg-JUN1979 TaxID=3391450 RepID=UPI0039A42A00